MFITTTVPNAPCGVERLKCVRGPLHCLYVPNAPCGVESLLPSVIILTGEYFVPNAPCGVESKANS